MDVNFVNNPESRCVDELWYSDGSLVIQAEQSVFRVYGAVLAAQSTFFRDMLLVPQPAEEPRIDGCPLVHIHDSAVDVKHFLKAIFDSAFFERPPAKVECEVLAGILRLSTKYDVDYLRKRCLLHLDTCYPDSLEGFDSRSKTSTISPEPYLSFFLLPLAHELDLVWLKPALMNIATSNGTECLLDGVPWKGSQALPLDPAIQRACLLAQFPLIMAQSQEMLPCFIAPSPANCKSPAQCNTKRLMFLKRAKVSAIAPLDIMTGKLQWDAFGSSVCAACVSQARVDLAAARQNLWNRLPGIFGLPSWEELRAMKAAALE